MKKYINENWSFTVTVIDHTKNKSPLHCRNGHEVGDTYTCEYGCPMPANGCDGFCSKTMYKLFPLMEAIRSGGDLRNLLPGADKHSCNFVCPDGVVWFRLEASNQGKAI